MCKWLFNIRFLCLGRVPHPARDACGPQGLPPPRMPGCCTVHGSAWEVYELYVGCGGNIC